jgi:hypothetical protein
VRGKLTDLVREDEGVEVVEEERDNDEDREILNPSHLDHLRDCGRVSAERERERQRNGEMSAEGVQESEKGMTDKRGCRGTLRVMETLHRFEGIELMGV